MFATSDINYMFILYAVLIKLMSLDEDVFN